MSISLPRKMRGMTLIELMIVVVIVGILAAIAYPSYRESVNKSRRTDGKSAVMNVAQRLERCFTLYNSYNAAACGVAFPMASPDGSYEVTLGARDATTFQLIASPTGPQAGDRCGSFTITHTGARGLQGADAGMTVDTCW